MDALEIADRTRRHPVRPNPPIEDGFSDDEDINPFGGGNYQGGRYRDIAARIRGSHYCESKLTRTGKATTSTDVFAFGTFILEVACGRRPIQPQRSPKEVVLVYWVFENWKEGAILETSDPRLGGDFLEEEMELVLKLGLLCSGSNAATRPSMRQVMQYLDGDVLLPEISLDTTGIGNQASSELVMSLLPSVTKSSDHSMSCTESIFNSGRNQTHQFPGKKAA
ncbi:hypothetical protein Vadar_026983 [Vaccinium darrowii]|uniref:Uncharacterized protein n=1 Tax=Vaccinium darrowii TaxID=229202 RepID=A0ACB7ZFI9_9ERIC|nr:hypothetical protein Vadar_026983 [Vaccinium darrowii]